jgi:hypothetical protein
LAFHLHLSKILPTVIYFLEFSIFWNQIGQHGLWQDQSRGGPGLVPVSRDRFQSLLFFNLCLKSLLFSNLCSKSLLNRSNLCSVDFFPLYIFPPSIQIFAHGFKSLLFFNLGSESMLFFNLGSESMLFFQSILAQNLCSLSTVHRRIQNRHGAEYSTPRTVPARGIRYQHRLGTECDTSLAIFFCFCLGEPLHH